MESRVRALGCIWGIGNAVLELRSFIDLRPIGYRAAARTTRRATRKFAPSSHLNVIEHLLTIAMPLEHEDHQLLQVVPNIPQP